MYAKSDEFDRDEARAALVKERKRNGQSPLASPAASASASPAMPAAAAVATAAVGLAPWVVDLSADSAVAVSAFSATRGARAGGAVTVAELTGDLFGPAWGAGDALCHCVSRCLAMGKGIAPIFKRKFGGVASLKAQEVGVGGVATLRSQEGTWVYYLITKEKYFNKPTYDTLRRSLEAMASHMQQHGVKRLAMPKIGCGLDGLRWRATKNGEMGVGGVKELLEEVFAGSGVGLTVYSL